ncbi:MAG: acetoacetate--CoA ligase [Candidatus Binatia bacterium]
MAEPLWAPVTERIKKARVTEFTRRQAACGVAVKNFEDLYRWSVAEREAFWKAVWDFCAVVGERGEHTLVSGNRMPGAHWFPEARLNFAENLLQGCDEEPAVLFRREDGLRRQLTFRELQQEVGRLHAAFRAAGLQPGDRVAAILPNIPEAVAAVLAVASLGGIWSSCSPDFGAAGVLDRFSQIEPKFLLAADGYLYRGTRFDSLEKLATIQAGLPTVERTVVVAYTADDPPLHDLRNAVLWSEFAGGETPPAPQFARFPFDQPLYILFSSGTTGKPKCIVHGAGGTLLQHVKEHQLHCDLGRGDRLFYFTTLGWMMWNWLVSGLASGATLVLYDGNPFHPGPGALWNLVAEEGVTVFGTSAKFIDASKKAGLEPSRTHDLSRLRTILSTGSPLVPESFDWVYESVKRDVHLASISGGTDIVSCFVLGCPVLPVYGGEIQCRGLGMKVEVFDENGNSVVGEPGELVCTAPFPSMPVGFWNDPDGTRYHAAYFERFPGVWHHGDWMQITEHGGAIIYGRSDATLNPGGVRIGTAEIYRQVEQLEEVEESVVVGQDTGDGDQRLVLFVKLREGVDLGDALRSRIRKRIRDNASPRHVPAIIAQVPDIPRTRNGKVSEIAVRDVLCGRPVKNTEALANPEALEHFRRVEEPEK